MIEQQEKAIKAFLKNCYTLIVKDFKNYEIKN